ncbi:hypothetical protein QOT17_005630 [Balamuthia mandrillaris]
MNRARKQMFKEKLLALEKITLKKKAVPTSLLQDITVFALSNVQLATALAEAVADFIEECEELEAIIGGFLLVDCICRKAEEEPENPMRRCEHARASYALEFARILPDAFNETFARLQENENAGVEEEIFKLLNLWQEHHVFPRPVILKFIKHYKGQSQSWGSLLKLIKKDQQEELQQQKEAPSSDSPRRRLRASTHSPQPNSRLTRCASGVFDQLKLNAINFTGLSEQELRKPQTKLKASTSAVAKSPSAATSSGSFIVVRRQKKNVDRRT